MADIGGETNISPDPKGVDADVRLLCDLLRGWEAPLYDLLTLVTQRSAMR